MSGGDLDQLNLTFLEVFGTVTSPVRSIGTSQPFAGLDLLSFSTQLIVYEMLRRTAFCFQAA